MRAGPNPARGISLFRVLSLLALTRIPTAKATCPAVNFLTLRDAQQGIVLYPSWHHR